MEKTMDFTFFPAAAGVLFALVPILLGSVAAQQPTGVLYQSIVPLEQNNASFRLHNAMCDNMWFFRMEHNVSR